ncbi:MAG: RNA-binding protein [Cyanobacteriota bacterium]
MTINVSNLPLSTTKSALEELFLSYGFDEIKIERIEDGNDEKIAYVQLKDEASEEDAVNTLDGAYWHARYLRVDIDRGKGGNKGHDQPTRQGTEQPKGDDKGRNQSTSQGSN